MTTLDAELQSEILSHVVENLGARAPTATGGNLILAIESRPGEGKSFHCKAVLGAAGVSMHRFQLSEFESEAAGVPATRIVERYLDASDAIESGAYSALILEDVDLGLGPTRSGEKSSDITQYTMNRDLLVGTLMALCDSPTLVWVPPDSKREDAGHRKLCARVPILMTGNDLRHVYGALMRHGRTRLIRWAPSAESRQAVVAELLPDLTAGEISDLISQYSDEPIAFWSSVQLEVASSVTRLALARHLLSDPHASMQVLIGIVAAMPRTVADHATVSAAAASIVERRESQSNR